MQTLRTKNYRLRWRFDFLGRSSSLGLWNSPGDIAQNGAWRQNKEGLLFAAVEGKDPETGITERLAECAGPDFVNFGWIAHARIAPFAGRTHQGATTLEGISLTTRDEVLEVYPDGHISRAVRTDAQKKTQFATFGR